MTHSCTVSSFEPPSLEKVNVRDLFKAAFDSVSHCLSPAIYSTLVYGSSGQTQASRQHCKCAVLEKQLLETVSSAKDRY